MSTQQWLKYSNLFIQKFIIVLISIILRRSLSIRTQNLSNCTSNYTLKKNSSTQSHCIFPHKHSNATPISTVASSKRSTTQILSRSAQIYKFLPDAIRFRGDLKADQSVQSITVRDNAKTLRNGECPSFVFSCTAGESEGIFQELEKIWDKAWFSARPPSLIQQLKKKWESQPTHLAAKSNEKKAKVRIPKVTACILITPWFIAPKIFPAANPLGQKICCEYFFISTSHVFCRMTLSPWQIN